jgi:hypothetical protein
MSIVVLAGFVFNRVYSRRVESKKLAEEKRLNDEYRLRADQIRKNTEEYGRKRRDESARRERVAQEEAARRQQAAQAAQAAEEETWRLRGELRVEIRNRGQVRNDGLWRDRIAEKVKTIGLDLAIQELDFLLAPGGGLRADAEAALAVLDPYEVAIAVSRSGHLATRVILQIAPSLKGTPPSQAVEAASALLEKFVTDSKNSERIPSVTGLSNLIDADVDLALRVLVRSFDLKLLRLLPRLLLIGDSSVAPDSIRNLKSSPEIFGILIRQLAMLLGMQDGAVTSEDSAQGISSFATAGVTFLKVNPSIADTKDIEAVLRLPPPPRIIRSEFDWGTAYGSERYETSDDDSKGLGIPELTELACTLLKQRHSAKTTRRH